MAKKRMGFEGKLFYGAPGSTGTTLLVNATDIAVNYEDTTVETDARGDSSGPPPATNSVVRRGVGIDFSMRVQDNDTALDALLTAVAAGTAVALRGQNHNSGKGPDADFYLSTGNHNQPLREGQLVQFNAVPTDDHDRAPQHYV